MSSSFDSPAFLQLVVEEENCLWEEPAITKNAVAVAAGNRYWCFERILLENMLLVSRTGNIGWRFQVIEQNGCHRK
jgi:hypothetical protein